ncbi:MAG: M23 family metallopeptidase [Alphaproteobacteria bacterium]
MTLRATLLLAVFLSAAPAPLNAVEHDIAMRDRLIDVRELLTHRHAHRSMLNARIERFSARLDQLQSEREFALEALSDQKDLARARERELDKFIPRLLPRLNVLDQSRKDGARAIAGLASMERHVTIKDRTRSRLLATKTMSIEQMRRASTAVRLLRRAANMMTARQRDVDFQIPLLAASAGRLDLQQNQLQRQRDAAVRDLAELTIEIERLTAEEHRISRSMIARRLEAQGSETADAGDADAISPDRRGLGKAQAAGADIIGIALNQTQPTPVARPQEGLLARSERSAVLPAMVRHATLSAKNETSARLAGWAAPQQPDTASVAMLDEAASGEHAVIGKRARPEFSGQPLIPVIEAIAYSRTVGYGGDDRPEIQIAAMPGQPVAAPDDGRVVFAGDFRSYGLLLIIEHGNGYHTLLWGFSWLDVEFGDTVQAGQIIGIVKDGSSPKLHVELRRNGQPVSPEVWLAASNSGVKG